MASSGAIRALAKEKHVRAVVRQYLIYQDMHKTVKDFDEEISHTMAIDTSAGRPRTPESNHARVVQFSGASVRAWDRWLHCKTFCLCVCVFDFLCWCFFFFFFSLRAFVFDCCSCSCLLSLLGLYSCVLFFLGFVFLSLLYYILLLLMLL